MSNMDKERHITMKGQLPQVSRPPNNQKASAQNPDAALLGLPLLTAARQLEAEQLSDTPVRVRPKQHE